MEYTSMRYELTLSWPNSHCGSIPVFAAYVPDFIVSLVFGKVDETQTAVETIKRHLSETGAPHEWTRDYRGIGLNLYGFTGLGSGAFVSFISTALNVSVQVTPRAK